MLPPNFRKIHTQLLRLHGRAGTGASGRRKGTCVDGKERDGEAGFAGGGDPIQFSNVITGSADPKKMYSVGAVDANILTDRLHRT